MNAATVMLLKAQRDEVRELLADTVSLWFDGSVKRISSQHRDRISFFRETIEYRIVDAVHQLDDARKNQEKRK